MVLFSLKKTKSFFAIEKKSCETQQNTQHTFRFLSVPLFPRMGKGAEGKRVDLKENKRSPELPTSWRKTVAAARLCATMESERNKLIKRSPFAKGDKAQSVSFVKRAKHRTGTLDKRNKNGSGQKHSATWGRGRTRQHPAKHGESRAAQNNQFCWG